MNNQEARGILANLEADYRNLDPLVLTNGSIQIVNERIEALGVAIFALQALDEIYAFYLSESSETTDGVLGIFDTLEEAPSAQPILQPTCNQLATDTISRLAAIDEIRKCRFVVDAIEKIRALPSAQPERKKGKWVGYDGDWLKTMCKCSECGAMIDINEKYRNFFCYHCGARMDSEQDE